MPTASGEYTMRAQPRRRKESASRGDEPVFLRKTYDMINSCDQTLAGWSAKGDTFVIKDPDRFAAEVIPTFFKHSKFSSFVRQLNFYGFRKVKALDGRDAAAAAGWWEFKHDLFTRATPHLIAEIKRATHYVAPPEAEVDALRTEVTTLTERMLAMDARIAALSALVDELRAQPSAAAAAAVAAAPAAAVPSKRRRVDGDASATAAAEEMAAAFGGGGGAMDAMLPPLPQTP
ncbi:HSF-type DNA-binding-domain-containing protein, partial [Tribonema minus]